MKNKKNTSVPEEEKEQAVAQEVQEETAETAAEVVEVDYQQELEKQKDAYLRLYAEFDNYKKRSARERVEWIKMAGAEVIEAMLPVIDDMERGIDLAHKLSKEEDIKGFELIYQKMIGILGQKGLKAMDIKAGDEFDVDLQEVVARIPAPSEEMKEKIIDVTQKGYHLGDKVLRYAKVVIGE